MPKVLVEVELDELKFDPSKIKMSDRFLRDYYSAVNRKRRCTTEKGGSVNHPAVENGYGGFPVSTELVFRDLMLSNGKVYPAPGKYQMHRGQLPSRETMIKAYCASIGPGSSGMQYTMRDRLTSQSLVEQGARGSTGNAPHCYTISQTAVDFCPIYGTTQPSFSMTARPKDPKSKTIGPGPQSYRVPIGIGGRKSRTAPGWKMGTARRFQTKDDAERRLCGQYLLPVEKFVEQDLAVLEKVLASGFTGNGGGV